MKPDADSKVKSNKDEIVWGIKVFLTVLFLFSCFVQFNDPDPFLWCALYGIAVVVSVCDLVFGLRQNGVFLALGIFYFCVMTFWMVSFWPWNIEEQREVGGLFLLAFWGGLNFWHYKYSSLMIHTG